MVETTKYTYDVFCIKDGDRYEYGLLFPPTPITYEDALIAARNAKVLYLSIQRGDVSISSSNEEMQEAFEDGPEYFLIYLLIKNLGWREAKSCDLAFV